MPPPISEQECLDFGHGFFGAPVGGSGVFRMADIQVPVGRPERWAFSLLENRDTSSLSEMAVRSIRSVTAILVDGTSPTPQRDGKYGSSLRTVSVYAEDAERCPLISVGRRDEQEPGPWTSLSVETLDEFRKLLTAGSVDFAGAPLISLEPELANPEDRRRLLLEAVPYAIKLRPDDRFSPPPWAPEDPFDAFDVDAVEVLFETHHPDADPDKPSCLRIRDLQDRRVGSSGAFEEYLFRFPGAESLEYFLARDALPPTAQPGELLLGAGRLAQKAFAYAAATPGRQLRLHEFHHPHPAPYCDAVRIAARCHYLDAVCEKGR